MRTTISLIIGLCTALIAPPVVAQVGIGNVQIGVPDTGRVLDPVLDRTTRIADRLDSDIRRLAEDRLHRLARLVHRNRSIMGRDASGNLARRGVLIAMGADDEAIANAQSAGYAVNHRENLQELGLEIVTFVLPPRISLADGQRQLRELMPRADVAADNLYFQAGDALEAPGAPQTITPAPAVRAITVGIIDGAPTGAISVEKIQGFARGGGQPSDHGSAVASLLRSVGVTRIKVADVYGTDPAGGNVMAITRALAWLVNEGAGVISISLVGPENIVLARAVAAARQRGTVIVAAVGNDGPASPPVYPASYEGVVAVTAVDRRGRALIEAGRALHLDYSAPGADIYGMDRRGRTVRLRGTSYATPLTAARVAHAMASGASWRDALDREAIDLGKRGADEVYGRGLVCRGCGQR